MAPGSDPAQDPSSQRLMTPKLLGASVAFLGGVVLFSWYLYTLELVTLPTLWVPMQYNTAVGFVLTGLAVVAHCVGRRRTAQVCGALAAGLGSVALAEQALGMQFDLVSLLLGREASATPTALMAPNTALCFSIAGGIVLVGSIKGTSQRWRTRTMGVMAAILASAGFVGLISYILNNDMSNGWTRFTQMEVHTGLAFVGLGVAFFGMVGHFRTRITERRLPHWAAWAAGGGVGLLILGIWVGLTSSEDHVRALATTRTNDTVIRHANQITQTHIHGLDRLANVFAHEAHRSAESFEHDVSLFASDVPGLVGLTWLDEQGEALYAHAPGVAGNPLGSALASSPVVQELMQRSRISGALATGDPAGEQGRVASFFLCMPVLDAGDENGFLVAEYAVDAYFDGIFVEGMGESFNVVLATESGDEFYRSAGPVDGAGKTAALLAGESPEEAAVGSLAIGDRIWTLNGEVDPFWAAGKRSASNTLILWVGIFLAAAIVFAVRKSELLVERAKSLEVASRTIEERSDSLREANDSLQEQAANLRATEERLRRTAREKRRVLDSLSAFLIGVDSDGVVTEWNFVSSELFGLRSSETLGRAFSSLNLPWDGDAIIGAVNECNESGERIRRDNVSIDFGAHEDPRVVSFTINPTQEERGRGFSIIGADVTERRMLEMQLTHSQKLESVGTLAAGIAHEINTPMQFVSDNVRFLSQSVNPIIGVLQLVPGLIEEARKGEPDQDLLNLIEQMLGDVDIDFLADEMPMAIDESLEGVQRVTTIVRAMKDFSHPGAEGVAEADINEAIETTLAVARNEYKYYATIETDFAELGPVECWVADLNQVFLNLLVNATHAIRDKIGQDSAELGTIRVSTRLAGNMAEIRFADSGTGIPKSVQSKVFEQFYTTKEIGKGTGLGLAIARSVVVDRHGGDLDFETVEGEGATFIIRIPLKQQAAIQEAHEAHPVC